MLFVYVQFLIKNVYTPQDVNKGGIACSALIKVGYPWHVVKEDESLDL